MRGLRTGNPYVWFLLAACALNLLPLAATRIFADNFLHVVRMHCYASQLWQGDIFPRWCFEADAGLGSPVFLFYPPLSYLISAIFYPLTWLGLSMDSVYLASCALVVAVAAYGCWRWLLPLSGPHAAALGAMLYLYLPYRSEVLVGRASYPELWVMAFAPLMALATRAVLAGSRKGALLLALWSACALLSEGSVAVCVLMGLGAQVLATGPRRWRVWLLFAASMLGAGLLVLPYGLQLAHYMPFTHMERVLRERPGYPSQFVRPLDFWRGRVAILPYFFGLGITLLAFAAMALAILRRKAQIQEPARREVLAWLAAGAVAAFMLFTISKPLWGLINLFVPFFFPWRMQLVVVMAACAAAAAWAHWLERIGQRRTVWGDITGVMLVLLCYEVLITRAARPDEAAKYEQLVAARVVCCVEYLTKWNMREYDDDGPVKSYEEQWALPLSRHGMKEPPRVEVVQGRASVQVRQWSWRGMVLSVDAPPQEGDIALRLYVRYFPLWRAKLMDKSKITLTPEPESGYMLLKLHPGAHMATIDMESHLDTLLGVGAKAAPP